MNKIKSKRRMEQIICYVVLILLAMLVLVPVLWMVSTAFKTEAQTYSPTGPNQPGVLPEIFHHLQFWKNDPEQPDYMYLCHDYLHHLRVPGRLRGDQIPV